MTAQKIRALRDHLQLSQAVRAAVANTSLPTMCKWWVGEERPSSPPLKLLNQSGYKGLEALV